MDDNLKIEAWLARLKVEKPKGWVLDLVKRILREHPDSKLAGQLKIQEKTAKEQQGGDKSKQPKNSPNKYLSERLNRRSWRSDPDLRNLLLKMVGEDRNLLGNLGVLPAGVNDQQIDQDPAVIDNLEDAVSCYGFFPSSRHGSEHFFSVQIVTLNYLMISKGRMAKIVIKNDNDDEDYAFMGFMAAIRAQELSEGFEDHEALRNFTEDLLRNYNQYKSSMELPPLTKEITDWLFQSLTLVYVPRFKYGIEELNQLRGSMENDDHRGYFDALENKIQILKEVAEELRTAYEENPQAYVVFKDAHNNPYTGYYSFGDGVHGELSDDDLKLVYKNHERVSRDLRARKGLFREREADWKKIVDVLDRTFINFSDIDPDIFSDCPTDR